MKKAWRVLDVAYARARAIDAAWKRSRRQEKRGATKDEFRRAMMELAARRRERDGMVQ